MHKPNAGKMLGFAMLMIYLACFTHHAFSNQITIENAKPGTAHWQITDFGSGSSTRDPEIAGFSTESDIAAGAALPVNVHRAGGEPGSFAVDVYRLGYYQGIGARQMGPETRHTIGVQLPCVEADGATRLVECSAWPVGFTIQTRRIGRAAFILRNSRINLVSSPTCYSLCATTTLPATEGQRPLLFSRTDVESYLAGTWFSWLQMGFAIRCSILNRICSAERIPMVRTSLMVLGAGYGEESC